MRFSTVAPFIILLCSFMGYGWSQNIYDLSCMHGGITWILVLRAVGIFIIPLGAILGYWV